MHGMGVFPLKKIALAGSLALWMFVAGSPARPQQAGQQMMAQQSTPNAPRPQQTVAQQSIPDAPQPQPTFQPGTVAPGKGSTSASDDDTNQAKPSTPKPPAATDKTPSAADQAPVLEPAPGQAQEVIRTLRTRVDLVIVPFTVKDGKNFVAGLHAHDVQIYENGASQSPTFFADYPAPLSVALVIDQSMTPDIMRGVNEALGALPDAFTRYDELSVFTYNKTPHMVTDFTGAQSPRLTQAIEVSKSTGRDVPMAGSYSGPMSCTTCINNQNFDPNTAAVRGNTNIQLTPEREFHPLNDAILAAAAALSRRPIEFRRVIYVISDGKDYGSKAKTNDVIQYLEHNQIEVDGTLVGDSSLPVLGFLDKLHLPLMMRDNVLVAYQKATGGQIDAEFRVATIEKSFARIAAEVRNRYEIGYYSHEPMIDGKYRTLEVVVLNHGSNLTVLAKKGYYPMATEMLPPNTRPTQ
jgi:VWFA-related protein